MLCVVYNRFYDVVTKGKKVECNHCVIKYYNEGKIQITNFYPGYSTEIEIDSSFLNECLCAMKDLILKIFCGEDGVVYENEKMKLIANLEFGEIEFRIYKKEKNKKELIAEMYRIENCRSFYKLFKTMITNGGKIGIKECDEIGEDKLVCIDNIYKKNKKRFNFNPITESYDNFVRECEQEYAKATKKQLNAIRLINKQLTFEFKESIELREDFTRIEASKIISEYNEIFNRAMKRLEKEKEKSKEIESRLQYECPGGFDGRDEWEFMAHMEHF